MAASRKVARNQSRPASKRTDAGGGLTDTIAAIATARGQAALAIVRLSGDRALRIADACFRGVNLMEAPSHTAHVGYFRAPDGREIDQVVVTLFKAPRSVTGEDVVEISCHGGDFASQFVLETLISHGARHAEPGEFTQRAFLNDKIDLVQAEAVADLIHASSSLAHQVSLQHLQGRYSRQLEQLRSELLELCAYVELELDFSEEDVEFADKSRLVALLDAADNLLGELLGSYRLGSLIRDGIRVVIAGRPNAGKSTLLNALAGRERAIVSPIPGTTRDEIDVDVEIEGMRYRFVDTAGLREAADAIEAEGVRRTHQSIETADMALYVYDVTAGLTDAEIDWIAGVRSRHPNMPMLIVGNKVDAIEEQPAAPSLKEALTFISAEEAQNDGAALEPLIGLIQQQAGVRLKRADASPVVINQRHLAHLSRARQGVNDALEALRAGASGDALALDLRIALQELGQITGVITNEDVLDQIFSRFCIGK